MDRWACVSFPELPRVVSKPHIDGALEAIHRALHSFSPYVEMSDEEPGVFWVDASGLLHLYPSLATWSDALRRNLREQLELRSIVVVGFSRFGTYALARTLRLGELPPRSRRAPGRELDSWVLESAQSEREIAQRVPLERLRVPHRLLSTLERLGVRTLGDLIKIPSSELRGRLGPDALELHRKATGGLWNPLQATVPEDPVSTVLYLDHAETDTQRLTFIIKSSLHELLGQLHERHQLLLELELNLELDNRTKLHESLKPAQPTLDSLQLLELVRLRLERLQLKAAVREVHLSTHGVPATTEQLTAFKDNPRRDKAAAQRALARIRAEFGEHSILRATLREGHLPEARFAWEPLPDLPRPDPKPRVAGERPLVRRFSGRAQALPPRRRHERDDGWLVKGLAAGPATDIQGPFIISGGWWVREVRRDYYFVQLQNNEILWVYYDRSRRRWFLHGEVC